MIKSFEKKLDENKDIVLDVKNSTEYQNKLAQEMLHRREIEDEKYSNQYNICCGGTTDARVLTFLSKFLIIFSTLIFSFVMILLTNDSAEKQVFIVLVNTILAVFLPSPQIKDKNKKNK